MDPRRPIPYEFPVRCRADLLELIAQHPPQLALLRAMRDPRGRVQCWGGFVPLRPFKVPGWIVDVTSRHKRTWHVAVLAVDQPRPHYRVELVDEIPWATWAPVRKGHWSEGDHPGFAHIWCVEALAKEANRETA